MKPGPPLSKDAVATITARLRSLLDGHQWRKARDEAKEWAKKDREQFLPFLIEANIGLIREMVRKGQRSEAGPALAYLKTIAPADQVAALEAELAAPPVVPAAAPASASVTKATKPSSPAPQGSVAKSKVNLPILGTLASKLSAGTALSPAEWRAIDLMVLQFSPSATPPADSAETQISQELTAVLQACEALGEGDFPRTLELLRPVPLKSVFQHWKSFFRAVIAAHEGEVEKAQRGFLSLAPSEVLATAAQPYQLWLKVPAKTDQPVPLDARVIGGLLALSGADPSTAPALLKAEQAWTSGKLPQAYQALSAGWKGGFPTHTAGLLGSFTDLVLYTRDLSPADMDKLFTVICRQLENGSSSSMPPATEIALLRWLLLNGHVLSSEDLQKDFARFLILHAKQPGFTSAREAMARAWLGERLALTDRSAFDCSPVRDSSASPSRKAVHAQRELEHAIRLAPDYFSPYLSLIQLLGRQNRIAERNRVLDQMRQRFPQDKLVLTLAATACLQGKDSTTALKYLTQARQLDPHDADLKDHFHRALLAQIFSLAGSKDKGKTSALPTLWQDLELLLLDQPPLHPRVRWMAWVAQGIASQGKEAKEWQAKAATLAPHPLLALCVEWFLRTAHDLPIPKDWSSRWTDALPQPDYRTIIDLLAIVEQRSINEGVGRDDRKPEEMLLSALDWHGPRKIADHNGVLALAKLLILKVKHDNDRFCLMCDRLFNELYEAISEHGTKGNADPHLRLARVLMDEDLDYEEAEYQPVKFLKKLIKDAASAKLPQVAAEATKVLQRYLDSDIEPEGDPFDVPRSMPGAPVNFGPFGEAPPPLPSGLPQAAAQLAVAIFNAKSDPKELKILRREVTETGIPPFLFDQLVQLSKRSTIGELISAVAAILSPALHTPPIPAKPKKPSPKTKETPKSKDAPKPREAAEKPVPPDQLELF